MFELSLKKIKECYKKFNILYFNGKLPRCSFCIKHTYNYVACFEYKRNKNGKPIGLYILFTNNIMWDEETFRNALMHEMIHCYLVCCCTKNKCTIEHGDDFIKIMNHFNNTYNFNIVVKSDITTLKPAHGISKFRWWLFKKIGR